MSNAPCFRLSSDGNRVRLPLVRRVTQRVRLKQPDVLSPRRLSRKFLRRTRLYNDADGVLKGGVLRQVLQVEVSAPHGKRRLCLFLRRRGRKFVKQARQLFVRQLAWNAKPDGGRNQIPKRHAPKLRRVLQRENVPPQPLLLRN